MGLPLMAPVLILESEAGTGMLEKRGGVRLLQPDEFSHHVCDCFAQEFRRGVRGVLRNWLWRNATQRLGASMNGSGTAQEHIQSSCCPG